jgi:SAM-dependent methyltransferase
MLIEESMGHEVTPSVASEQDRVNRRIYRAANISRWYRSAALDFTEALAFLKYQPAFAGRDVLDLGVGTGRTSRYLAPLAGRYVCVDSSPAMIAHVRTHLPGLDIRETDIRDLNPFAAGSFDFVLASCNLLDAVSHQDRLRALAEIWRVLRPAGVFMFSAHNRRWRSALHGPRLGRARNPASQALLVWRYVRSLVNHARVRRYRRLEREYAVLNDSGHDYAALHYYIDRDTQRRQLEQAGFRLCEVFDVRGRSLQDGDDDRESPSLMYVAERTATAGTGGGVQPAAGPRD